VFYKFKVADKKFDLIRGLQKQSNCKDKGYLTNEKCFPHLF